jgi:peptidoglycan/LPS O-acetylase OafA/YrhL
MAGDRRAGATATVRDGAASGRLIAIDIVRGFAICWVVLYHVWTDLRYPNVYPAQGDAFRAAGNRLLDGDVIGAVTGAINAFLRVGYLGVPLFMMLSGLSLTLSAMRRGGHPEWTGFMRRRLRRVMVPYWFGFAATVAFAAVLAAVQWQRHGGDFLSTYVRHGDIPLDGGQLAAGALVLPRVWRDEWQFAPEGSLWFVLVIVQYYLLFPLLLPLLRRLGPVVFAALTLVVTWGALAAMTAISGDLQQHGTWVEMTSPFRLFEFGAGMALGWAIATGAGREGMRPLVAPVLAVAGGALFVAACMIDADARWTASVQGPAIVLAFVLVFGPMLLGRRESAGMALRGLAAVGVVSYTVLIVSEPLRSVTHTMSAERAPDAAIVAWVLCGMLPITALLARPLAIALGLVDRAARPPLTVRELVGGTEQLPQPSAVTVPEEPA